MTTDLRQITSCEVCGAATLTPVLNLGLHPMCDDLVAIGDQRRCREYPIEILFCAQCRTAHQRFQIPKDQLFPPTYHYRSRHTADVLSGMRELVEASASHLGGLAGKSVVDIGCNDGSLLSIFKEAGASQTGGIEPTGAAADARERGHEVVQDFLSEEVARRFVGHYGQPDIITFTNVFAHIEDLSAVIRSLLILAHDDTAIIIENHYLGSVIGRNQFDTFYHEHPRTYSHTSFEVIARSLGRRITDVTFPKRYGGNIRITMRKTAVEPGPMDDQSKSIRDREHAFGADLASMAESIEIWKVRKQAEIDAAVRRHGRLRAKAFPGRSAIPIKMLGLDESMISAIHEKPASGKIGHYAPGTRIPIVSDDAFDVTEPAPVINLAWHIADEIKGYMRGRGFVGAFIDIISPRDFDSRAP